MIDGSWERRTQTTFGGAWTLGDKKKVKPPQALKADNVEFVGSDAQTRTGFERAYNANEAISAMVGWRSSLGRNLVWFRPGQGIRLIDLTLASPSTQNIHSEASGTAAVFADAGSRLYASIFGSDGKGAASPVCINKQSGTWKADHLFPPPLTYTPSAPIEPGAGSITAGTHYIGYALEFRHHGPIRLSPDSGSGTPDDTTFQPIAFTASGSKNCRVTLNTLWPNDAVRVHIVMSPVSNPSRYIFVPGAYAAVTGGTTHSVQITFDLTDDELLRAAGFGEATDYLYFLSQDISLNDPFTPSVIFPHGDRMVYVTELEDIVGNTYGVAFVSNRNSFQQVTVDQHIIQLPGQRRIVTGFSLDGSLYLLDEHGTFRTYDNSLTPSQWPVPAVVDAHRGTQAPRGVTVAATRDYAWVADEEGLFCFEGGIYSKIPISYGQTDWARINWAQASKLQAVDNAAKRRVLVLAALDGATDPNYVMVWDYTVGKGAGQAKYSLWYFESYAPGAIAIVENALDAADSDVKFGEEVWVAPSAAGYILRQMKDSETTPYRDDSDEKIHFIYDTPYRPEKKSRHQVQSHTGCLLTIRGNGTPTIYPQRIGEKLGKSLRTIDLTDNPDEEYFRGFYENSEALGLRIEQNQLDGWVSISRLIQFFEGFTEQR